MRRDDRRRGAGADGGRAARRRALLLSLLLPLLLLLLSDAPSLGCSRRGLRHRCCHGGESPTSIGDSSVPRWRLPVLRLRGPLGRPAMGLVGPWPHFPQGEL